MTTYNISELTTTRAQLNAFPNQFPSHAPFTKEQVESAKVVEVHYSNDLYAVVGTYEDSDAHGILVHRITKKGTLDKRKGSTYIFFGEIVTIHCEPEATKQEPSPVNATIQYELVKDLFEARGYSVTYSASNGRGETVVSNGTHEVRISDALIKKAPLSLHDWAVENKFKEALSEGTQQATSDSKVEEVQKVNQSPKLTTAQQQVLEHLHNAKYIINEPLAREINFETFLNGTRYGYKLINEGTAYTKVSDATIVGDNDYFIKGHSSTLKALEKKGYIRINVLGGEGYDYVSLVEPVQHELPPSELARVVINTTSYSEWLGGEYTSKDIYYCEVGCEAELLEHLGRKGNTHEIRYSSVVQITTWNGGKR